MLEKSVRVSCLCLALVGLFLVWQFAPERAYAQASVLELSADCGGLVKVSGTLARLFMTKSKSFAGVLMQDEHSLLVLLRSPDFVEGERVTVYGRANLYSGACWLFADKVESLD